MIRIAPIYNEPYQLEDDKRHYPYFVEAITAILQIVCHYLLLRAVINSCYANSNLQ